jgi:hypothetical protein
MNMKTKTKQVEIDGVLTTITICPPSRRKAGLGLTGPKRQKTSSVRGERHCANENNQFTFGPDDEVST